MKLNRRQFVTSTTLALTAGATFPGAGRAEANSGPPAGKAPLIVSTWPFGKAANEVALQALLRGASGVDAVEQGIGFTESEGNPYVGLSGGPNAAGVVQLDACIMAGPGHRAGSVAGLEGIKHPISAARRVMEKTPHVMLVGEGARMFALAEGLESVELRSAELYEAWRRKRATTPSGGPAPNTHDTIALLVLAADGNVFGGCSTSGLGGKLPGRVGDSPILGSGLYVDNEVGAAGATGIGENVMRYCGTFLVVELMRQGLHPQAACRAALQRIARQDPRREALSVSFVALDRKGRYGAATAGQAFEYAVTTRASSRVVPCTGSARLDPVPQRPPQR